VSNCVILPCFVRYMGKENFEEELLCCTDEAVPPDFRFLNEYFSEKDIDRGNCVRVCIDGAASMTAWCSSKNKKVAPKEMLLTLYIIHRDHLAAMKAPADLKNVLDKVMILFDWGNFAFAFVARISVAEPLLQFSAYEW